MRSEKYPRSTAGSRRQAFKLRHHLLTKRIAIIRQIVSNDDTKRLDMGPYRPQDMVIGLPVAL